ncbi:MAG TPA: hypothetical protein VFV37_08925 [Luteibaculaceae bacterium]|nr:hypothetical protein [Luteibaculaceae bacterium]
MNKTLLAGLIILSHFHSVFSQSHSFPLYADNPVWGVYGTYNFYNVPQQTWKYYYEKDTSLCNESYSKLILPPEMISLDSIIFVRVSSKKVLFKKAPNCSEEEQLLYDFNLQVGDTGSFLILGRKFWVHSIDSISFNSNVARKFHIKRYDGNDSAIVDMYWIEGVGSTYHPFYKFVPMQSTAPSIFSLQCLQLNGNEYYQNPNFNECNFTTGIDGSSSKLEEKLLFYPNPVSMFLFSNQELKNVRYSISDNNRRIVKQGFFGDYIDFTDLREGFYILSINNSHYPIAKE